MEMKTGLIELNIIPTDRIYNWIETLQLKGAGFTSAINNKLLLNTMRCYLLLHALNEEDLIETADAAIFEHEHYKRGVMDIEEAVRVAIRAAYKEIMDNTK